MLILRSEQMHAFSQGLLATFEKEMLAHSQDFYPELCASIGKDQVQFFVRSALQRAGTFGFTARGPLRLFIEMNLLFGVSFDTDPQYPWAGVILRNGKAQMERAAALYWNIHDYQKAIHHPDGAQLCESLKQAGTLAPAGFGSSSPDDAASLRIAICRVFPEKVAYMGASALVALLDATLHTARARNIDGFSGQLLLLALMIVCGRGCTDDPLFPWISNSLNHEPRHGYTDNNALRLQTEAFAWFTEVLILHK